MRNKILMGASLAAFLAATPALAQTDSSSTGCKAGADNQQAQDEKSGSGGNLSDKLASCGGVLKPPSVGDNMAKTTPQTGKSRIIKPKDLPGQQSPDAPKKKQD